MLQFPELSQFRVTLTPFSPYENDATWTIFWGQTLEPLSENYERLFPLGKNSLSLSLSLIVSFSLCLSLSLSLSLLANSCLARPLTHERKYHAPDST